MTSPHDTSQPLLELQDVRKWYPVNRSFLAKLFDREVSYVKAVDGVSLQLRSGETLGLVGESGSGKSTLGELIVHLQEPTGGSILFEGRSISELYGKELKHFRRETQVIFQDPYATLNPRFSIYRTVVEPLVVNGVRNQRERQERVSVALTRAGLDPDDALLNAYPHQLSGGQRQRAAIARAIVLEPKLLVADEPVSMLDVSIRSGILNLLAELRTTLDLSILFISHDLSTVQYLCDRVAIMYLGKLVEIGPTARVIGNAHHPYSRALLNAVPIVDPDIDRERAEIKDESSSALELPPGCRFAPRCPFVTDECRAAEPRLDELSSNHWVRCIHPQFEPLWPDSDQKEAERSNHYG
jgi:peptide/nickel transport system ATP-binding protein